VHKVESRHFQLNRGQFLDEQVFRYNNRKAAHDGERFHRVMSNIAGRRLTYEQLTGKGTDAVHQA